MIVYIMSHWLTMTIIGLTTDILLLHIVPKYHTCYSSWCTNYSKPQYSKHKVLTKFSATNINITSVQFNHINILNLKNTILSISWKWKYEKIQTSGRKNIYSKCKQRHCHATSL